jgi:hypothetical protein
VINRENILQHIHIRAVSKKRRNYRHKSDDLLAIHSNNALLLLSFHHVPVSRTKKQKGMLEDSNTSKKDLLVS